MTEHIKINDTAPRAEYVGDGSTTAFPAPFPFLASADVQVWIANTRQEEITDYTVSGAGETYGGTVTFGLAPASGSSVVIYRRAGVKRLSDFLPGGSLRADTLNEEFDRLTLSMQEVTTRLDRTLRLADHDAGPVPASLPAATARASRVLSFDADGQPVAGPETSSLSDIDGAVVAATASASAAATSASAAATNAALVGDIAALVQNIPATTAATGDGAELIFALNQTPIDARALVVSLDGVLQHQSAYSVSGSDIAFTAAPPAGVAIEVRDLSSTAIVNAVHVSDLAAISAAISTVANVAGDVSAVVANTGSITDVADDLNGANTIAAAVTSATSAAASATAASASETSAGGSAATAVSSAAAATGSASSAAEAQIDAEIARAAAETAQTAAEAAETNSASAETNAASSATAAAASASSAVAAVAGASGAAARSGFRARFGKTPSAVMSFHLGDVSNLTLTRATAGSAINEQGGPENAAIDTARIEHDIGTSERLGLLLEPAGTNLVKRSSDLSHSDWVTNAGYFTRTGGKADPAGGSTATRLRCDIAGTGAANSIRQFTASGGFTDGEMSIWVRRVSGTGRVRFLRMNGNPGGTDITADLTSEWQPFSYADTSGGGGFLYFGVMLEVLNDEIDLAFAQCEGDSIHELGSFIETTTASATRSADLATVDLSVLAGFRPSAFTLIADLTIRGDDGTALSIGFGASQECAFDVQSGDLHITSSNGLNLTAASGLSPGDRILVALRMQDDNVAVSVNGAAVVTDTSYSMTANANELQLGSNISAADLLACVIHEVAFFGPLPDATLEAMSNV
ncbi:MAG: phage tail fiber protein [Minwuia sp.]|nr:phage tail fiber protein [Minwuia sp.]